MDDHGKGNSVRKWTGALVAAAGVLNMLALAALFIFPPDAVEPCSSPWEWWGWLARVQFMPAVFAMDVSVLGAIVAATFFFGRIYCEVVCPLGVAQDVLRKSSFLGRLSVRRVCPRLPVPKSIWAVRLSILGAAVVAAVAGLGAFWLDPYAIFCRFLAIFPVRETDAAFAIFAGVPFAAVAILSFVGKGRAWCNVICPVGTVLAGIARFKAAKTPFARSCGHCRACFPGGAKAASVSKKGENK